MIVTKTRKMFSFLPRINSSVTLGLSFLLLIYEQILSSKTINTSRFFFTFFLDSTLQYFVGIVDIIRIFNKSFTIITILYVYLFTFVE